ncbi:hypothetical protein [Isoptericola nanjingensis]|uniref:hypothetical protein n=1 Tax=Isoptericola nanjingensis TaxID=903413 RepID=UPI003D263673
MGDEGDTVDDQQSAEWMLPLPVREGWTPIDEWLTPRRTFNEHGRRWLREWLELFYPTRTQMTPEAYGALKTFLVQNDDALKTTGPRLGAPTNEAQALLYQLELEDRQATLLHFIDFTLRGLCSDLDDQSVERRQMLSGLFEEAHSVWRVVMLGTDERGRGYYGLRQEVSPTADSAAHLAASGPKRRAGEHLRLAWSKLYGLHPDPSGAYWHAVKAIEAAGKSTLAPDDDDATLGKLMSNLRTGRSNFCVRLDGDEHNDSRDTIHHLMGMVWRSEFDRHGTDDPEVPLGVSGADAEAATFAAVTLVQYFQAGHISRTKAES